MNLCLGLTERFGAAEEQNYSGRGPRKQLLKVFGKKVFVLATLLDPRYKTAAFEGKQASLFQVMAALIKLLHFISVPLPEPFNLSRYRPTKENALNVLLAECSRLISQELDVQVIDETVQEENARDSQGSQEDPNIGNANESILEALFGNENEAAEAPQVNVLNQENEVSNYLNEARLSLNANPLVFWRANAKKYPLLSKIARKVLSVPASSGSIERAFSTAGAISRTRRSKMSMSCLESLLITREDKKRCK